MDEEQLLFCLKDAFTFPDETPKNAELLGVVPRNGELYYIYRNEEGEYLYETERGFAFKKMMKNAQKKKH